ncbi:MAG: hypothetical protein N3H32_06360, partial [Nitrososphaeria archaeon]|nr:hypothetical protein [Nitrososphaeria archaeon]
REVSGEVEVYLRGERVTGFGRGRSPVSASISAVANVVSRVLGPVEGVECSVYVPPNPDRCPAEAEVVLRFNGSTLVGRGLAHDPAMAVAMAVGGAVSQALSVRTGGDGS